MTSIIGVLENVGANAELRYASAEELQQAMSQAGMDAQAKVAILGNDRSTLQFITGSPTIASKVITPGKEDDEDDVPDHDDDEIRSVRLDALITT